MAKLYADENFPQPTVLALREFGHGVLTIVESDYAEQAIPDNDVLALPTKTKRILVILNRRDFIRLHRETTDHSGIIVCTFDADFAALAERIHDALEQTSTMQSQLLRVNRPPVQKDD